VSDYRLISFVVAALGVTSRVGDYYFTRARLEPAASRNPARNDQLLQHIGARPGLPLGANIVLLGRDQPFTA